MASLPPAKRIQTRSRTARGLYPEHWRGLNEQLERIAGFTQKPTQTRVEAMRELQVILPPLRNQPQTAIGRLEREHRLANELFQQILALDDPNRPGLVCYCVEHIVDAEIPCPYPQTCEWQTAPAHVDLMLRFLSMDDALPILLRWTTFRDPYTPRGHFATFVGVLLIQALHARHYPAAFKKYAQWLIESKGIRRPRVLDYYANALAYFYDIPQHPRGIDYRDRTRNGPHDSQYDDLRTLDALGGIKRQLVPVLESLVERGDLQVYIFLCYHSRLWTPQVGIPPVWATMKHSPLLERLHVQRVYGQRTSNVSRYWFDTLELADEDWPYEILSFPGPPRNAPTLQQPDFVIDLRTGERTDIIAIPDPIHE